MPRIDAEKLAIALTNALTNARKYSSNGPVVVEMIAPQGTGEIAIRVIDRGIGMTPEQTTRMFERFFRVDPGHPVKGTGLGANIMKEIVEAHGGRIEVSSRPGQGTAVTFWLPAAVDGEIATVDPNGGARP
jgi:signal transduction histidine kinase